MIRAYRLGVERGRSTGRERPTWLDYAWVVIESDGAITCLDPDDDADFREGMSDAKDMAE
jgi:hypothetical protein